MSRGRGLETIEVAEINNVFGRSLPNDFLDQKVMLRDSLGIGGRPYTEISAGIGRYEIHIGKWGFVSTTKPKDYYNTLIHEMTHVWQGHYSWWGIAGVWLSSIKCHICRQMNAYDYGVGNLGKDWGDFGKEEQAQIVEDWYKGGLQTADPRFQYIRDNIRPGNN